MTSVTSFNDSPVLIVRSVLSYVDRIKNTEIDSTALRTLKESIRSLVEICNKKFFHQLSLEIIEVPIDEAGFEIRSPYFKDLRFSEMISFVVDNIEQAERFSDQNVCIDALRVLINYSNIVVYSRFDHGLDLRQTHIDEVNN